MAARLSPSGLILDTRITLPHFSVSSATSFPNSAGVIGMGSPPSSARRACRLQVDDELEFRRLQHRQGGGLRAFEGFAPVGTHPTIHAPTIGVGGGALHTSGHS